MSKTRWHLSQEPSTLVPSDCLALGALNRFQLSQVKGAIIDVLQCSAKRCRAPLAKSHNSITAPTFTASFFKRNCCALFRKSSFTFVMYQTTYCLLRKDICTVRST